MSEQPDKAKPQLTLKFGNRTNFTERECTNSILPFCVLIGFNKNVTSLNSPVIFRKKVVSEKEKDGKIISS